MIDSHCHLADEAFAADLPEVIDRARRAGVARVLCILALGDAAEAERAARVAALWPDVRFAVGVHPHRASAFAGRLEAIDAALDAVLAADARVRAIGEIGLDYHYEFSPRDVQQAVFRRQLAYARARDLPVVIHMREAEADTLAAVREAGGGRLRGVFHCFTAGEGAAREALALGFHLSFAGIVTFPKAGALRAVAAAVPDGRYLVETDAPYLAPTPYRGRRNEPAWVARVVETVAAARGVPPGTVAEASARAFEALCGA
ncbi:MAG TPA: TatD family hydrolase [Vicinamibacterales bacterium]|nr:TatD family hydrolase [Vicinamibacterales bacterium]